MEFQTHSIIVSTKFHHRPCDSIIVSTKFHHRLNKISSSSVYWPEEIPSSSLREILIANYSRTVLQIQKILVFIYSTQLSLTKCSVIFSYNQHTCSLNECKHSKRWPISAILTRWNNYIIVRFPPVGRRYFFLFLEMNQSRKTLPVNI